MYTIRVCPASNGGESCAFYVLSRGGNTGKPSRTPFANSFEVKAATEQEAQRLYWIAFALWQSGRLRPLMRGSVIAFVAVGEYRSLFAKAEREAPQDAQQLAESMEKVQQLIAQAHERIRLCTQYKMLLASQFFKEAKPL